MAHMYSNPNLSDSKTHALNQKSVLLKIPFTAEFLLDSLVSLMSSELSDLGNT